jgi:hypothetical protein
MTISGTEMAMETLRVSHNILQDKTVSQNRAETIPAAVCKNGLLIHSSSYRIYYAFAVDR